MIMLMFLQNKFDIRLPHHAWATGSGNNSFYQWILNISTIMSSD